MWKKRVEEWSFKKTMILNEDNEIQEEEDGDAWAQEILSEEEVEEGTEL